MDINKIKEKKGKDKLVMLTCYDYQMAKILDSSEIDMILVGDSLGMVFKGEPNTRNVKIEEMLYHLRAVKRGVKRKPIILDMPFRSYETPEMAFENAKRFVEAGADGVKIEGNPAIVSHLVERGIKVMGHTGLLPQQYKKYRVVGKKDEERKRVMEESLQLEEAGAFAVVLESIPEELGKEITEKLKIPTIGIGAGRFCDGQVLVINDLLGMDPEFSPKYVKRYAQLHRIILDAVNRFSKDVKEKKYPDEKHIYR